MLKRNEKTRGKTNSSGVLIGFYETQKVELIIKNTLSSGKDRVIISVKIQSPSYFKFFKICVTLQHFRYCGRC